MRANILRPGTLTPLSPSGRGLRRLTLLLGALYLLVGAAGCTKPAQEPIETGPLDGFGPPHVLKSEKDGWTTYRFEDLGFDQSLPGEPVPRKELPRGKKSKKPGKWAVYDVQTDSLTAQITVGKYPVRLKPTLGEEAEQWVTLSGEAGPVVGKPERKNLKIGGREAIRIRWTNKIEGDATTMEVYVVEDPRLMLTWMSAYPSKWAQQAQGEIDRTMRSLVFHAR